MTLWKDKHYYSLDYYLKEQFHEKVYKLALNAGMTCPNRDGTLGTSGCIFCSEGGSGDFAGAASESITNQISAAKALVRDKSNSGLYIAYFQAYTNTYAPVDSLRKVFTEAIEHPDIVALSIATRPDCLPEEVLHLLGEMNRLKPVYLELGLQTIHEGTAALIHRGYSLPVFEQALEALTYVGIPVIVHVILGLPGESKEHILETIDYLGERNIHGIKLQLMHVLKHTELETLFLKQPELFQLLEFDDYIDTLISCIEHLPPHIVIHRITGDGPKHLLLAPTWSANKRLVLNTIQKELKIRNTFQGRCVRVDE